MENWQASNGKDKQPHLLWRAQLDQAVHMLHVHISLITALVVPSTRVGGWFIENIVSLNRQVNPAVAFRLMQALAQHASCTQPGADIIRCNIVAARCFFYLAPPFRLFTPVSHD